MASIIKGVVRSCKQQNGGSHGGNPWILLMGSDSEAVRVSHGGKP